MGEGVVKNQEKFPTLCIDGPKRGNREYFARESNLKFARRRRLITWHGQKYFLFCKTEGFEKPPF